MHLLSEEHNLRSIAAYIANGSITPKMHDFVATPTEFPFARQDDLFRGRAAYPAGDLHNT